MERDKQNPLSRFRQRVVQMRSVTAVGGESWLLVQTGREIPAASSNNLAAPIAGSQSELLIPVCG